MKRQSIFHAYGVASQPWEISRRDFTSIIIHSIKNSKTVSISAENWAWTFGSQKHNCWMSQEENDKVRIIP